MLPGYSVYCGVTITVPAASAKLIDLVTAAMKAGNNDVPPLGAAREIYLSADSGNTNKIILVGDSFVAVSPQRCGYGLLAAQARNYRSGYLDMVLTGRIYVVEATGTALLNVELMS
jgi:hypothetical protein